MNFIHLDQLNATQVQQYRSIVKAAFPPIIQSSEIIINYWSKIEEYFPTHQLFAIDQNENLIALANMVPFVWDDKPDQLPENGWDWMVRKGIKDFEENARPNSLGGLQIIVAKEHQGKGYSKLIIAQAKKLKQSKQYKNFFIPIRPTFKQHYAEMSMLDYLNYKKDNKIYDPWIRTHVNSGAKIIKICENSMNVKGPIPFWEKLSQSKINKSGPLAIEGALSPVKIDLETNVGEYREANIWISY